MKTDTNRIPREDRGNDVAGLISLEPRFVSLGSGFFLDRETGHVVAL